MLHCYLQSLVVYIDLTMFIGRSLKTFNPKNQKLLKSNVTLGGEGVTVQVGSGDLAMRRKAHNVCV